jgi:hypothetical protein
VLADDADVGFANKRDFCPEDKVAKLGLLERRGFGSWRYFRYTQSYA